MDNNSFLLKCEELQNGVTFDKIIDLDFALITYTKELKYYFNYAHLNNLINQDQLNIIENTFKKLNKKPAIYFENRQELDSLVKFLEKNNYNKTWEDSWMFHSGENINLTEPKVIKVENEKQLQEFINIFNLCYQKDDPQNPYGEVGEYLALSEIAWRNNHESGRIEYFIFYNNNEPVAVSALINFNKIGYISNVGSLQKVRGQGFGKIASLYSVKKSVENGNTLHCLATEEGQYPYEFYKRIGFVSRFTAYGYTKQV